MTSVVWIASRLLYEKKDCPMDNPSFLISVWVINPSKTARACCVMTGASGG